MLTLRRSLCKLSIAVVLGLGLTAILLLGLMPREVESSVTAQLPSNPVLAGSPTGIITAVGRHLERNGVPFEVRGMNYYPKDFAWERFWISHTTAITQIDTELDLAKALGLNTVRIFVKYDLFDGSDETHLDHLKDFVDRLRVRDMVAIVTLFDLYSSPPYSDYPASRRHISIVVNTLGITNPTVLAWDIKNEPDRDYAEFGEDEVRTWLTNMINYTRELDPNHLITIGFYGAVTGTLCYDPAKTDKVYSPTIAAEFAPLVDFVSMHYFLSERCFESDLQALQSLIDDKPLLLEEFGLHTMDTGDDRHTETEQAAYYNALLSLSEAYDLAGYLFWTLTDFSHILTGSKETHHCQGILRNSLVDVCQVTSTLDYTEKPAADTIRHHYDDSVAYLDLFDSWVVSDTDEAPPGWIDNLSQVGALMRGYNASQDPAYLLWSRDPGKVAFTKVASKGISVTGVATSPVLTNVNIDHYPFLTGQVYSYSIRDITNGTHSTLHIGVKDGAQITRLLTITPGTVLPYTFSLDLRHPPAGWSGTRNFQTVFELVPEGTGDGYSAAYELDWIALARAMLEVTKQANPSPVQDGSPLTYTLRVTNTGHVDLTATITDILPSQVTPTGVLTWTPTITAPSGIWVQHVVVTLQTGYTGTLRNMVEVTSQEGASGRASATVCANKCIYYLPLILKNYSPPISWAENRSYCTTCAEEDNVNVPIFCDQQVSRFRMVATHPTYCPCVFDDCPPDRSGCDSEGELPTAQAADTCTKLCDDYINNAIWVCTTPDFWRPYSMTVVCDSSKAIGHYFQWVRRIEGTNEWPQFLVIYEDGNMRLKPHPPDGISDVCFGSSVIIGPATPAQRPYVDIQEVHVNLSALSLDITYRNGETAHVNLSVDRSRAVAEAEAGYSTSAGIPFATFRSMWVSDSNCDVDHIQSPDGDFPILDNCLDSWTSLSGPWWFFYRKFWSKHNTSAPDIRIEVLDCPD